MKRYSILSLLFMFFVFGGVAQVDSLILPFNATDLTEMQKKLNPDYLAYPLALASQVPEINCNQTCMEYVDLGLSVLWATCNVGAESPEDYGDYIPWGEAYAKSIYSYETYKYCKGSINTMTKYCNDSEYGYNGFVDDKTILDPEDDAATIRWGGSWRMPTETEFLELIEQCTWSLVTQNGVKGYKVTGKNGNAIFLPAAGTTNEEEFVNIGIGGLYWTSSLCSSMTYMARHMNFYKSNSVVMQSRNRNFGHSVRPVCPKKQESIEYYDTVAICDGDPYFWEVTGKTYYVAGDYEVIRTSQFGCDSIYHLHLMVGKIWLKEDTVNICDNEEYLWHNHYNDTVFRGLSVGQYVIRDSLKTNFFGCDSVYRLVINVYPTYYIDEGRDTICITELSEYKWERHEHKTFNFDLNKDDTTYILYDSLLTYFHACDSIHRLCLTVLSEKGCNSQSDCMEYVDLGLSVLWATCNVGAEKPEDYGDYFAWGETTTKTDYSWATYKYCKGTDKTMTKYCNNSSYGYNGFTDTKTVLDPEDDAATVNWGGAWRMPTDAEFTELREKCQWTWTTQNGVEGYKVVGPNGNSIFLPAAGFMYAYGTPLDSVGSGGDYWSSSLDLSYPYSAYDVYFNSRDVISHHYGYYGNRNEGQSVRPVCPKKQEHEYVDLGLSVKWATCNVGAEKPEDYGDYFAWGETQPKGQYDWTTYKYCKGTNKTMTKYCNNSSYGNNGFTDNKTELDPEDDAATVNWGGNWRMPTDAEMTELREQCTWTWITQNGVNGYKVVGKNGNSIFLPAAGYMYSSSLNNAGSNGYYWSGSLSTSLPYGAYYAGFNSSRVYRSYDTRYYGRSVRPVCP